MKTWMFCIVFVIELLNCSCLLSSLINFSAQLGSIQFLVLEYKNLEPLPSAHQTLIYASITQGKSCNTPFHHPGFPSSHLTTACFIFTSLGMIDKTPVRKMV